MSRHVRAFSHIVLGLLLSRQEGRPEAPEGSEVESLHLDLEQAVNVLRAQGLVSAASADPDAPLVLTEQGYNFAVYQQLHEPRAFVSPVTPQVRSALTGLFREVARRRLNKGLSLDFGRSLHFARTVQGAGREAVRILEQLGDELLATGRAVPDGLGNLIAPCPGCRVQRAQGYGIPGAEPGFSGGDIPPYPHPTPRAYPPSSEFQYPAVPSSQSPGVAPDSPPSLQNEIQAMDNLIQKLQQELGDQA